MDNEIQDNPLVSIIIPNYNYQDWVGEAIKSCLNQTYKNIEIIVIDDCSADDSRKSIGKLQKVNSGIIKFFTTPHQSGATCARNLGVEKSKGGYFLFLDADDLLLPNAVMSLLNTIKKNNTDAAVGGWINFCQGSGRCEYVNNEPFFPDDLLASLIKRPIVGPAVLVKRNKRRWNENLYVSQLFDYFFWLFGQDYSISYINQAVAKIRQHSMPHRVTVKHEHYWPPDRLKLITEYKNFLKQKGNLNFKREAALDEKIISLVYLAKRRQVSGCKKYLDYVNIKKLPDYFWYKFWGLSGFIYHLGPKLGLNLFYFANKLLGRV